MPFLSANSQRVQKYRSVYELQVCRYYWWHERSKAGAFD
jgi:hypothetical protein